MKERTLFDGKRLKGNRLTRLQVFTPHRVEPIKYNDIILITAEVNDKDDIISLYVQWESGCYCKFYNLKGAVIEIAPRA